jgi:hypothetical protein
VPKGEWPNLPRGVAALTTRQLNQLGDPAMPSDPMTTSQQPNDALAGKLKRTELQHSASSIAGREIVQVTARACMWPDLRGRQSASP